MRGTNKSLTQVSSREAYALFERMSKSALFDLVVDLVRRSAGDDRLDGPELVDAVIEEFEPVRHVRRDPVPRAPGGKLSADAARRRLVELVEQIAAAGNGWAPSDSLVRRMRAEGWTDAQGRGDIRQLVERGVLGRRFEEGVAHYRVNAAAGGVRCG